MIFVETVEELYPMVERIKEIQPPLVVKQLSWDRFQIQSQSKRNEFHNVACGKDYRDWKYASCSCWPSKKGNLCYHVVLVIDAQAKMFERYPDKMTFDGDFMINWG